LSDPAPTGWVPSLPFFPRRSTICRSRLSIATIP